MPPCSSSGGHYPTAAGGCKGSPLLSWPVPSHQLRQLVVVVFSSALGWWTGSDQNVQFRLMVGEPPFSTITIYLLLDAHPGMELWCFTKSLCQAELRGWCRHPSVQEPPGAEPAEMEGVQQEVCCLHQETANREGSFWSRGRSLQTHGSGSLRLRNVLFAERHCLNELLDMVGTAEVEIFVLGRKKEPF